MKTAGILVNKEDGSYDYKILNEWQLCPKCEGKGYRIPYPGGYEAAELIGAGKLSAICDLCNGKKIISKVNGLPPYTESDDEVQKRMDEEFNSLPKL